MATADLVGRGICLLRLLAIVGLVRVEPGVKAWKVVLGTSGNFCLVHSIIPLFGGVLERVTI